MKKLITLFLIVLYPLNASAGTCYGSADCQRKMNEQIREANLRQMEETQRRNEQIEQNRRMREMIEDSNRYK